MDMRPFFGWMKQKVADLINESGDPTATCPVRLPGILILVAMTYKLLQIEVAHFEPAYFTSFAFGAATVMGAIIGKQFIEGKRDA